MRFALFFFDRFFLFVYRFCLRPSLQFKQPDRLSLQARQETQTRNEIDELGVYQQIFLYLTIVLECAAGLLITLMTRQPRLAEAPT